MNRILLFLVLASLSACVASEDEPTGPIDNTTLYFPDDNSDTWEKITPESIQWKTAELEPLYSFLAVNNTRAFIILKDGKIVVEKYWGKNITNTGSFGKNSIWYWASAGKTLTSFLVGVAQQEGLLNIEDKTSDYLGPHWTSMSLQQEDLITVKHQLTMTTGLEYSVPDPFCTSQSCLKYKADAGTQWYYHNAPYTLLDAVVSAASNMTFKAFSDEYLEKKIGMSGLWQESVTSDNNIYWSTAKDAARFGLLILNHGKWKEEQIMRDSVYFEAMVNTSQQLNPSYGYLWWLNGKSSIVFPGLPLSFNVSMAEHAPDDLFAAMGKNGQFIDIVPGENLVVIRMGEAPDNSLVPVKFHDELWEKLESLRD